MLPPIVLVHGAWGGAWIWRRVLAPLRAAGHEVHALTLTGLGERAHLRRADTGLRTHIDDVLGLVRAEELRNVVLVGHSYAGMVITGAADALLAQEPGSLGQLIYVDAMVPEPGESWSSTHDAATQAARDAQGLAHQTLPPADPAAFGLAGADRDWLLRRQTPQPYAPYREPLHFDAARWRQAPRAFIDCTAPALPTIAASRQRVRAQPGWQITEMATGHCPQVSAPQAFVDALLGAVRAVPAPV